MSLFNPIRTFSLLLCVMLSTSAASATEAEQSLVNELAQCAAYYDIAATAIASMKAPQMQQVGEKLKLSSAKAIAIAGQYVSPEQVKNEIASASKDQQASLAGSSSLRGLMSQYKEICQQILSDPKQRLDYWTMVTM